MILHLLFFVFSHVKWFYCHFVCTISSFASQFPLKVGVLNSWLDEINWRKKLTAGLPWRALSRKPLWYLGPLFIIGGPGSATANGRWGKGGVKSKQIRIAPKFIEPNQNKWSIQSNKKVRKLQIKTNYAILSTFSCITCNFYEFGVTILILNMFQQF